MIEATLRYDGKLYRLEYHDCDSFDDLPQELCTQVYGVCFLGGQLLIVHNEAKDTWSPAGGTIEPGESIEQALIREVQEESNMRVLVWRPIGYQKVTDPEGAVIYQLRAYCKVEKIGEFDGDPDNDVDKIKLIHPKDVKKYFDWKEIGDRIMRRVFKYQAAELVRG